MAAIRSTAAVGGGVIGGAWAARFVFNGFDCKIFDPHPEAERIVGEVMANAERPPEERISLRTIAMPDDVRAEHG